MNSKMAFGQDTQNTHSSTLRADDLLTSDTLTSFSTKKGYSSLPAILGTTQLTRTAKQSLLNSSNVSVTKLEGESSAFVFDTMNGRMKPFCSITNYDNQDSSTSLSKLAFGVTLDDNFDNAYSIGISQYANFHDTSDVHNVYSKGHSHIGVELSYEADYLGSQLGLNTYITSSKKAGEEQKEALVFIGGVFRF